MSARINNKNNIEPNEEKLKELILFISERSEGDEYFGSTKLNKLLFFSDFLAYVYLGKPVTGYKYEAMPEGPMLSDFYVIRSELEEEGDIAIRKQDFRGFVQHKTFALRNPDINQFTSEEIDIVTRIISDMWDKSASEISALSHGFLGWKAVDAGEEIPYETALVGTRDLTVEEWEYPENVTLNLNKIGVNIEDLAV